MGQDIKINISEESLTAFVNAAAAAVSNISDQIAAFKANAAKLTQEDLFKGENAATVCESIKDMCDTVDIVEQRLKAAHDVAVQMSSSFMAINAKNKTKLSNAQADARNMKVAADNRG